MGIIFAVFHLLGKIPLFKQPLYIAVRYLGKISKTRVVSSDEGRVQRIVVTYLGRTVHVKEAKTSSLLTCDAKYDGQNILKGEGSKIPRNASNHSPIDTAFQLLRLEP
jgi:hypothetical protein